MLRVLFVMGSFTLFMPAARADVFDSSDNSYTTTENELVHRTVQVHDLAASGGIADVDWYRIVAKEYSSYEIVVDATTADISPITLQRIDSDGTTSLQTSSGTSSIGYSRVLRWENTTGSPKSQYIKVSGPTTGGCTTACTANASYRIRAYETSYTIARYYEHGTISTSVFVENPNDYSTTVHVNYWQGNTATGTLLDTATATIPARNVHKFTTPAGATSTTGYVTVTSDAGYGGLWGKASQGDSDTSLGTPSFDHLMQPRR